MAASLGFNPRAREGATSVPGGRSAWRASFNPRAREGATAQGGRRCSMNLVSIHAPVRARLVVIVEHAPALAVSIHAPVRARRVKAISPTPGQVEFQSTRP